jgi:hypothetical protein
MRLQPQEERSPAGGEFRYALNAASATEDAVATGADRACDHEQHDGEQQLTLQKLHYADNGDDHCE